MGLEWVVAWKGGWLGGGLTAYCFPAVPLAGARPAAACRCQLDAAYHPPPPVSLSACRRVNEAADNLDLWDDMAGQLQTPVAAATQRRRRSLQQQQRQHDRQSLGTRPPPSAAAVTATAADAP